MKRFDIAIIIAAVGLVAAGGGFALGRLTAPKAGTVASANGSGGQGGFGARGGQGGGFRRGGGFGTRGTVSAVSGSTITMTDSSGATKTVNVSSSTQYLNFSDRSSATLADVTAGTTISADGQTNTDGSIDATRVIINPPAPGSFGGGQGGGSGGPSQVN